MTLTTTVYRPTLQAMVSDACQINDFDHSDELDRLQVNVSDACQINDFDH